MIVVFMYVSIYVCACRRFEVTEGWMKDEGLPNHGLFQLTYCSGAGVGKYGCKPLPLLRRALTHLTLVRK